MDAPNFTGANLTNLDVDSSFITDANFTDADLAGAWFYPLAENASWDNTICPTGVNSDDNGGNCDGEWF